MTDTTHRVVFMRDVIDARCVTTTRATLILGCGHKRVWRGRGIRPMRMHCLECEGAGLVDPPQIFDGRLSRADQRGVDRRAVAAALEDVQ